MLTGIKVIIADDNSFNRIAIKAIVQRWGILIDFAENGKEVIDKLDTSSHRLVLMDLNMPVVDGYTAICQIRQNGLELPVIALTASMSKATTEKAILCGASQVLHKPVDPTILLIRVNK
jgi:CheY-like chemotaxis protein